MGVTRETSEVKKEVSRVLSHYDVPADDSMLILKRIDAPVVNEREMAAFLGLLVVGLSIRRS